MDIISWILYLIIAIPILRKSVFDSPTIFVFTFEWHLFQRNRLLDELESNLRKAIQLKLLSRGINLGSLDDIDLDQYSSEEDSRYENEKKK